MSEQFDKLNHWYGWNGGECPVHPLTEVQIACKEGQHFQGSAKNYAWEHDLPRTKFHSDIIAFRVTLLYVELKKPLDWREAFKAEVYNNLTAADNQDVPLEEYPDRILTVLESIVGPRHPAVIQWRTDAIEACAVIAERYGETDAAKDMRAMKGGAA